MQVIEQIVNASEGDLRKAITYLQSAARLKDSDEITEQDICEIAGVCIQYSVLKKQLISVISTGHPHGHSGRSDQSMLFRLI